MHRTGDYGIEDVCRIEDYGIEEEHRIGDFGIEDMHKQEIRVFKMSI